MIFRKAIKLSADFRVKENEMMKKDNISVPEGYFEELRQRLSLIPAERTSVFSRVAPYFALAASFLIILVVGTVIVGKTTADSAFDDDIDSFIVADLIPSTDPYALFRNEVEETSSLSEEDIVNYLIESGLSVNYIEYIQNENQ